jgi:hypothetical protein
VLGACHIQPLQACKAAAEAAAATESAVTACARKPTCTSAAFKSVNGQLPASKSISISIDSCCSNMRLYAIKALKNSKAAAAAASQQHCICHDAIQVQPLHAGSCFSLSSAMT